MISVNATEVRKEFSVFIDRAIREKPQFIKRTRDYLMMADVRFLEDLLAECVFTARSYPEEDGSVTLSLDALDLAENAPTQEECRAALARSILDYAEDFYGEYALYAAAPNRKKHIPYVYKALILGNAEKVEASIECRDGRN